MSAQLVQQASNSKTAAGTTLAVTISAPKNGNFLVLVITSDGGASVSSISGGGVTWVKSILAGIGAGFNEIWYGLGANAGGTTVTITYAASVASAAAIFMEWNGVFPIAPEDGAGLANNGTTSPAATATHTQVHKPNLLIAGINCDVDPTTVTNGFTTLSKPTQPGNFADVGAAYLFSTDAASTSTAFTVAGTTGWNTTIAAFKVVGPPPPLYPLYPDRLSKAKSEVASDDFNRADSATLGANWTVMTGTNALQIVTNQVEGTNVGTANVEYYSATQWLPDQYSEVKIIAINTSFGPGPAIRCSATANTCYAYSAADLALIKVIAGGETILASGGFNVVANDVIRVEAEGNIIRVSLNGVLQYQVKDSAISGGSPGIRINTGGEAVTTAIVDNWKGGNLVPRPYYGESTRPKLLDPNHVVGLYY